MCGTWVKEEGFSKVAGRESTGEVRLPHRPPGPTVHLDDDESCWDKLGKAEIAPEIRGDDG